MGWACSTCGGRWGGVNGVLVGKTKGKNHLEDPGVDGKIILRWIFRKWDVGGMYWIELAQDRDRWRVLVNFMELHLIHDGSSIG
jgi:hypothetical protein